MVEDQKGSLEFISTDKIVQRRQHGQRLANARLDFIKQRRIHEMGQENGTKTNLQEASRDERGAREYAAQQMWVEYRGKTDAVTQLLNHRGFGEALRSNLEKAKGNYRLMLIAGDLDYFKSVNDKHGHLAGDAFLGKVGRTIKSILRKDDIAGRPGGEEFMVLAIPSMENDRRKPTPIEPPDQIFLNALHITERLRRAISEITLQVGQKILRDRTMSFGITYSIDSDTPEVIKDRADAALYLAKQHERNCIVIATPMGNDTAFDIVNFPLRLDSSRALQDLGFTDIGRIRNDLLPNKEELMNNVIKAQ